MKNINVFRNIPWITSIELVILVLIISFTFYTTLPVNTHFLTEKKLSITKGTTAKSIISQLAGRGYNVGFIDQFILQKMGKIKSGKITFKTHTFNRIDFLYKLTQAKVPLFKITLIPGETKEIFFKLVADKLDINETKLLQAYKKKSKYPEAGIYADTYLAPKNMNEDNLIAFLLNSSNRKYKKISSKYYDEFNQTQWHKILTVASIVQKEAASNAEMPLVASVIYNRLKKNMRLQMDGTLNYGKYSHIKVTPQRIKNDLSSFNTYKHKGLPPSPIGSVSQSAIHAAIKPDKTSFLFFMRNKQGLHDFTTTFKKHRKNIKKAR